ncbi:hypothetical protein BGZ65_001640, partial [Modicella reniformis]
MTITLSGFKSHGIREPLINRIAGILDEHPDGTQIARELLQNSDDARPTVQLQTLDGNIRPLNCAFQGLETSSIRDSRLKQSVHELTSLFADLGIVMLDYFSNSRHPFLVEHVPSAERSLVLGFIAQRCGNSWPENRVITREEAKILRGMINNSSAKKIKSFAMKLGHLRIWQSWTQIGEDHLLICAHDSSFLDCSSLHVDCGLNINWSALGDNSDFIREACNKHFSIMGANQVSIVRAVETRLLPRFLNGSLECTGVTRVAYIEVFKKIMHFVEEDEHNTAARNLLQNMRFFLARDRSFRSSDALFDPQDTLCNTIFADMPSKLPDQSIWDLIWKTKKHLFLLRDSNDPAVVRECATHVLDLTQGHTTLTPEIVHSRATTLINFIYENESQINWLEPQWKIVPAEVTTKPLHSEQVPNIPAYQSFGELIDPIWQDVVWTQCAFFPENLKPSQHFKNRYPRVGIPTADMIVEHLKVLVNDLAPKMTSLDLQLAFKSELSKVYKVLNKVGQNSEGIKGLLEVGFRKPYILKGFGANPSDPKSWLWPNQLMLDIENPTRREWVVPQDLLPFRQFLVAAGVKQMQKVEGSATAPESGRNESLEVMLLRCFKTQKQHSGCLNVRFKFVDGRQILAHRSILVHMSEYFDRRFADVWAESTLDSSDP